MGLDLKHIKDTPGAKHTLLNVLGLAALYNLFLLCDSAIPADVIKVFKANRIVWAGCPDKRVVDKDSTLGSEFLAYTSDNCIYHKVIFAESPWQHEMVERHARVLADITRASISESSVSGAEHLTYVKRMAGLAKHRIPC